MWLHVVIVILCALYINDIKTTRGVICDILRCNIIFKVWKGIGLIQPLEINTVQKSVDEILYQFQNNLTYVQLVGDLSNEFEYSRTCLNRMPLGPELLASNPSVTTAFLCVYDMFKGL